MNHIIQFNTKHLARQIILQNLMDYITRFPQKERDLDETFIQRLIPTLKEFKSIGLYDPMGYEPNLLSLLPVLFFDKKSVSFPWFGKKKQMKFLEIFNLSVDLIEHTSEKIRIPDPALYEVNPDVILIPGIGYTKEKYRLGAGGGFYDRYLALSKHKPLTIGCFYSCGLCKFPVESHDISLNIIVTEQSFL